MKLKSILLGAALFLGASGVAKADKGMWLLNELNKQNVERMRELGFNLPIDSLYSLDKPSVANAVVIFGGGCTGVTVSDQGLIFTNHHCGYSSIQSQSTVNHDYLRDGFVSQTMGEELPIPGLSVKYLRKITKVTDQVEAQLKGITDEMERLSKAQKVCAELAKKENAGENQLCFVEPFYANNEYFLIIYDVFKDVRMVFAPPSSVGKFGGDTDNWMWPRHTGDFSVFRVYAGANNAPAEYNKNNKPYKPVYYAAVSTQGYKADDYAMTIGFPGSTDRYLTSWGVEDRIENENNPRIEVRGIKQGIWKEAMSADQATRIMYASKYAQSANYWKNSIGMNRGLARLDVINRKRAEERAFADWVRKSGKQAVYGDVLPSLEKAYKEGAEANRNMNYVFEALFGGTEVVRLAQFANALTANHSEEARASILKSLNEKYKDYLPSLDRKVLPAMLDVVRQRVSADKLPDIFKTIDKKFKGDTKKYADYVFNNSIIPYSDKLHAALESLDNDKLIKTFKKDPAIALMESVISSARAIQSESMLSAYTIKKGRRLYFAGMREMNPDKALPSDANFTMRMSYGSIKGYQPQDGAWYNYYTTGKGVLEKQDPKSDEFAVQEDILNLFRTKDYGRYAENGELHIAFLSTNDITGGNSGSPVFDKNGRLIGLAFDGNWEAMSGDIEFEPDLQRTISIDIRYVLFMIDKWGKCPRLINELKLM